MRNRAEHAEGHSKGFQTYLLGRGRLKHTIACMKEAQRAQILSLFHSVGIEDLGEPRNASAYLLNLKS